MSWLTDKAGRPLKMRPCEDCGVIIPMAVNQRRCKPCAKKRAAEKTKSYKAATYKPRNSVEAKAYELRRQKVHFSFDGATWRWFWKGLQNGGFKTRRDAVKDAANAIL